MVNKIKVTTIVPTLAKSAGGPAFTVPPTMDSLASKNITLNVVTLDGAPSEINLPKDNRVIVQNITLINVSKNIKKRILSYSPNIYSSLNKVIQSNNPDIVHSQGVWTPFNHYSVSIARKLNIPYMVTTHGMLTNWLMHKKWLKKKIGWYLYQRNDLECSKVIHCTAEIEAEDIRKLGIQAPIALIPNGLELPTWKVVRKTNDNRLRTLLFLSRISPKKNLELLFSVWKKLALKEWRLLVVGPDEQNYRRKLERIIEKENIKNVTWLGEVHGEEKWEIYRSADIFVLPSHTENFGTVIAEAMACGLPVITTHGTPWNELETFDCGWWIPINESALLNTLIFSTRLTDEKRVQMGLKGRKLIEEKYAWSPITDRLIEVYRWMQLGGDPPKCVRLS